MAQVLNDGTIRHESNCLADLGCTQASVASRLTDEEILNLVELHTRIDSGSLPQFVVDRCKESAAVLRDYVWLRKLENALYERIKEYRDKHQDEVIVICVPINRCLEGF